MVIYTSEYTGSAYAKCPATGALLQTPLYEDLTFDTCLDNWCEVEFDLFSQGSDEALREFPSCCSGIRPARK